MALSLVKFATKLKLGPILFQTNCFKRKIYFRSFQTASKTFAEKIEQRSFSEEEKGKFGDLVYATPPKMQNFVTAFKYVSLLTVTSGFNLQYAAIFDEFLGTSNVAVLTGFCIFASIVSVTAGAVAFAIPKMFVTEMFYNSENRKYAALLKTLFGSQRALTFQKSDLLSPPSGMPAGFYRAFAGSAFINGYTWPILLLPPNYLSKKAMEDIISARQGKNK